MHQCYWWAVHERGCEDRFVWSVYRMNKVKGVGKEEGKRKGERSKKGGGK